LEPIIIRLELVHRRAGEEAAAGKSRSSMSNHQAAATLRKVASDESHRVCAAEGSGAAGSADQLLKVEEEVMNIGLALEDGLQDAG
jgi:hypothetical protein